MSLRCDVGANPAASAALPVGNDEAPGSVLILTLGVAPEFPNVCGEGAVADTPPFGKNPDGPVAVGFCAGRSFATLAELFVCPFPGKNPPFGAAGKPFENPDTAGASDFFSSPAWGDAEEGLLAFVLAVVGKETPVALIPAPEAAGVGLNPNEVADAPLEAAAGAAPAAPNPKEKVVVPDCPFTWPPGANGKEAPVEGGGAAGLGATVVFVPPWAAAGAPSLGASQAAHFVNLLSMKRWQLEHFHLPWVLCLNKSPHPPGVSSNFLRDLHLGHIGSISS